MLAYDCMSTVILIDKSIKIQLYVLRKVTFIFVFHIFPVVKATKYLNVMLFEPTI